MLAPVYAWLVKGVEEPFLIDTECLTKEALELSPAFVGEDDLPIEESLEKRGFSASEIETIILTHLHVDHFLNAKRFRNAKLIIQEDELAFARDPHAAPCLPNRITGSGMKGSTARLFRSIVKGSWGLNGFHEPDEI